jgi:hypothetical protein
MKWENHHKRQIGQTQGAVYRSVCIIYSWILLNKLNETLLGLLRRLVRATVLGQDSFLT